MTIFLNEMPFDINAPVIDILPEDYGIWFVDAMDHPETYVGKTVRFKGRALKPRGMGSKFFVPGSNSNDLAVQTIRHFWDMCAKAHIPRKLPREHG